MRYIVIPKSQSAHCCFEATVIDMQQPRIVNGQHMLYDGVLRYEAVCECFDILDAQSIADALNTTEKK